MILNSCKESEGQGLNEYRDIGSGGVGGIWGGVPVYPFIRVNVLGQTRKYVSSL